MNSKEYREFLEAYDGIYEQVGVPTNNPEKTLQDIINSDKKYGGGTVVPRTERKESKSSLVRQAEEYTVYDEVLNFLLDEGCTLEESNYIMTYVVEQGMHPQEVVARGIANILGLDKPHPTQVFAQGLRKMLYPNKPQEVKAPKPPASAPKVTKVSSPAAKPTVAKPNPYRPGKPGVTIRATGPNLDKFPELARFANQADQGRKIAEPVVKTAGALTSLGRMGRLGIAGAVMAPRPTADGTLTAALKRGDYRPMQGPPAPKPTTSAAPKPAPKPTTSAAPKPAPKATTSAAPKPQDPDLLKYNELRKTNPAAAKELGDKIWSRKYRPATTSSEVA